MVLDNISDKPKKILLIAVDFPPVSGGISISIYNFWRYFPSDRIVVLAPFHKGGRSFDIKQNFTIYRTKKQRGNSLTGKMRTVFDLFLETKRVIKKEQIKGIHCLHLNSTALIGYFLKIFRGIDYSVYIFGAEFAKHKGLKWLQKILLNKAKRLIVISEFAKDVVIREGVRNRRFIKASPGVDLKKFQPGLDCQEIVNRYQLQGKKVIFTVSRLAPNKGFDTALKALPVVLRRMPGVVYVIGGEGPCGMELKALAKSLNLQDRVIFVGFIPDDDLPRYYELCDVFLLLTREIKEKGNVEGFGMVFIEANACGKAVVGGKAGGTPEAIVDGKTEFLVDPLNLSEISEKLIQLLANEDLAKRLGD
ncbi:MAG: glycosyltransferase family 4 protein, partial [Candidatus Aminicenantes bacterium]